MLYPFCKHTHTYTSDSIPRWMTTLCFFPLLLQMFIPGCYGAACWIPILRLKRNNPSFVNTTSTFLFSLSLSLSHTHTQTPHSLNADLFSWGNLTFSQTNSNEHMCPPVDTHPLHRLAHRTAVDMNQAKSIVKVRSACYLMVELKKRTASHTPSSPEAETSFFSSLAFGIEFLQQLYYGWSMFDRKYVVCEYELTWTNMKEEEPQLYFCWELNWISWCCA